MDFKDLLLQAEKNNKAAAQQSQHVKRISTHFSAPAKKEEKSSSSKPKSEALQKLLEEKERERRQRKEAEAKEKRRQEKSRQEQEKEEKRKNTFRIPKKVAVEEQPSDAESFSSISSDEDANNAKTAQQGSSEKSHKSSSHAHSHSKDKHSSSEKSSKQSSSHSSKSSSKEHSSKHSDNHSKTDRSGHSSSDKHSTEKDKSGSSKTHKSSSKKEHSHSSSSKERTPGSSKDRPDGSSKSHSHSSSSKEHAHSSSNKDRSSSSNKSHSHGSSSKEHSSSNKEHRHGSSKSHSGSSKTQDKSRTVSKEKLSGVTLNDSSGYVTSPSLNSESDDDERPSKSRSQKHSSKSELPSNHYRTEAMKQEENSDMPVVLTRHHLNPTIQRQGGALEDRMKMLEKLKAIRERMADDDPGYSRKRAAKGEVKKRRAKREKLEGDFTGSCMEKINYEEEEKPSLKRPEPKPEEFKPEKPVKQKPLKMHNRNKLIKSREKSSGSHKIKSDSKSSSKVNRFDAMHEKPKKKPKPHPRPPPVNFADLMKMAEQRQAEPVMVEVAPKKEKEKRPMTQEEIDRKHAREERLKTKEYKDWYKYGENAKTTQQKSALDENSEAQSSGGFVRRDHNVMPSSGASSSQSKSSFSIPRKSDVSSSGKGSVSVSSSSRPAAPEPTAARASGSKSQPHPTPGSKPQPHPTRPGMIANKPRAMAQHMNSQNKSSEPERPRSEQKARVGGPSREPPSQPRPQAAKVVDKTKGGNAWDSLFSRPEYTKLKQHPVSKKRMVIDSEEEEDDDYDDDMDDFIDDEGEEDMDSVSGAIRQLFGYDKRRYRDEDDDDRNMEASFSQVMKEEARSARLGRQEDLEDIRREEEELKQKAMRKKMRR